MIHYHKLEASDNYIYLVDGTEEDNPVIVGESDDAPYVLLSVPRWNKELNAVENFYEVFNKETSVVESRLRVGLVIAASMFEHLVSQYKDFRRAGTVEVLNETELNEVDDVPDVNVH